MNARKVESNKGSNSFLLAAVAFVILSIPDVSFATDPVIRSGSSPPNPQFPIATIWISTNCEVAPQNPIPSVPVAIRKEPNGNWIYGYSNLDGWAICDIYEAGTYDFAGSGCLESRDPDVYHSNCGKTVTVHNGDGDILAGKCIMCSCSSPPPYSPYSPLP